MKLSSRTSVSASSSCSTLASLLLGEVQRQRPLAAVDDVERPRAVPPVARRRVVGERMAEERAGLVEAMRRLDLDDLRAEVGQQRAEVGDREDRGEVDDAQPGERGLAPRTRRARGPVGRSAAERRRAAADALRRGRHGAIAAGKRTPGRSSKACHTPRASSCGQSRRSDGVCTTPLRYPSPRRAQEELPAVTPPRGARRGSPAARRRGACATRCSRSAGRPGGGRRRGPRGASPR